MANEKAKEITLGEDFGAVAISVNGKRIEVSADGVIDIKPVNSNIMTAIAASRGAYKIGDHLVEGKLTTVVFSFDENNHPIRVPTFVFIGKSNFSDQDVAIKKENERLGLHGDRMLTPLDGNECAQLAKVWDKVALPVSGHEPPRFSANETPWFWGESESTDEDRARVFRGGVEAATFDSKRCLRPVPVALRGPIRS
jgi:hypothetical protein